MGDAAAYSKAYSDSGWLVSDETEECVDWKI